MYTHSVRSETQTDPHERHVQLCLHDFTGHVRTLAVCRTGGGDGRGCSGTTSSPLIILMDLQFMNTQWTSHLKSTQVLLHINFMYKFFIALERLHLVYIAILQNYHQSYLFNEISLKYIFNNHKHQKNWNFQNCSILFYNPLFVFHYVFSHKSLLCLSEPPAQTSVRQSRTWSQTY